MRLSQNHMSSWLLWISCGVQIFEDNGEGVFHDFGSSSCWFTCWFTHFQFRLSHENDKVGDTIGCLPGYPAIKGVCRNGHPQTVMIQMRHLPNTSDDPVSLPQLPFSPIGNLAFPNWATKKTLTTFHYTVCLIGILIRVYYNPYIIG